MEGNMKMFRREEFTEEFEGYFIEKMQDLYGRIEACEENQYPVNMVIKLYTELEGMLKGICYLAEYVTTEKEWKKLKRSMKNWEMSLTWAWQYVASCKWTEDLGREVEIREERADGNTYEVTFGENRYKVMGKDQVTRLLSDMKH